MAKRLSKKPARRVAIPRTANEKLLNDAVRHATYLQRYSNQEVRQIIGFLNKQLVADLEKELAARLANIATRGLEHSIASNQRLGQLVDATKTIIGTAMKEAQVKATGSLKEFALSESQWATATIVRAVPVAINLVIPNVQTIHSVVTSRPFEGRLLREWFRDLGAKTQKDLVAQVNIGVARGDTTDKIVQRVIGTKKASYTDGVLNTTRRGAESVVRTAINHTSTHAREETYANNSDVVDSVRWVSTLDDRTTEICMGYDGDIFPINEGPRPPAHFNCRSTTVPVLKSWKALGIDLKEAPEGTRASMDGQVPASMTYNEWLRDQPAEVQNEALGPGRADLFRGGMDVDKFTNDRGQTLTLKELRAKEGLE